MKTTRALSGTFTNGFDRAGTLSARAPQGLRASLKGVACLVAFVIGISLSIGATPADSAPHKTIDPKTYIRFNYNNKQALCLIRLYGKESAFRVDAIGNLNSPTKSYVYGIPQLKNPIIKDLSAIEQIDYGMKYIAHRYGKEGGPCRAWEHWQKKGWH
jgi:hypothetical protein